MQGSKRARNTPSIANNTKIFGIMAGLGPRIGRASGNNAMANYIATRAGKPILALNGKTPAQQKLYLQQNKLLSVNPLSSGGVGKKTLMFR
jgi:hypothetical protein